MIVGPNNWAKKILFEPLQTSSKLSAILQMICMLGLVRLDWIDCRWTTEMIAKEELLLLLEGQTAHLPSPKNHYASDITICSDASIFATGKQRIAFRGRGNSTMEDDMMAERRNVLELFHQIPVGKLKEVHPCHKCFAKLALTRELYFCYSCIPVSHITHVTLNVTPHVTCNTLHT